MLKPTGSITGNCFPSAFHLAKKLLDHGEMDVRICHGVVSGTGRLVGLRFPHGWVEIDDIVIDASNGRTVVFRRQEYYALGEVESVVRYSVDDAVSFMLDSMHYGPWEL